ncbi:MAG: ATP-dependent 6-phosphofructokinase [Blastocatellia bacterium]|nr:ATP-dependent 6-phosphofructokinase [Blastocatellia bacterium]
MAPKRIGVVTGGGDCPGLNAVIRAVVIGAVNRGWQVFGIERGFEGFLYPDRIHKLDAQSVRGIIHRGGTMLGTSNRGNPFSMEVTVDGEKRQVDVSDRVAAQFHALGLESLIVIGGDGTLQIAEVLTHKGITVIGVPKTIDNDLMATELTFGFSTAIATATDAIDKVHATAESHERVMIVEVMGHFAGWIALYSGVAGGADVILLPEIPYRLDSIKRKLDARWASRRRFAIVVVAEGATPEGGEMIFRAPGAGAGAPRLGGIADQLAEEIYQYTGYETRSLTLGHLQRGGQPTGADRLLATRFGAAAVRAIERGERNVMVALHDSKIVTVPLEQAISKTKYVPRDSDIILSARELGISFGDE